MKPKISCLMITSLDGGLHPSRWTTSPNGSREDWLTAYEGMHDSLAGDAWLVGRKTMAEISPVKAHPPIDFKRPDRPIHIADSFASSFAVAVDASGKLHFDKGDVTGDHIVVLLGQGVPDSHLAELAADGVSYIVSDTPEIDFKSMIATLGATFKLRHILLEGGSGLNGSMLAEGLVDELHLLVAPALDGGAAADRVVSSGETGLAGKAQLRLAGVNEIEAGIVYLRYEVIR